MNSLDYKFDFRDERNLSLVMDFYELTMSQCYFNSDHRDRIVTFDLFYRKNPDEGGYAVFAGLEEVIGYIQNLHFEDEDIAYLRSLHKFSEPFLNYLRHFIFTGDIYAIKEGTPVFPYEPLIRVKAKIIDAQLIETAMLLCINHQTLIATKARRIVKAAKGRAIMEFGARRAHNFDSANYGARAAYIGGVAGTATTYAGQKFGMPVLGTMAHSFVQSFDSEYEAFLAYAKTYPDSCTVLLDTYDTLNSGLINAIRVAKDYLEPNGYRMQGVRIDSGDMAYLSKKIRKALDEAGMQDCNIVVSNSLDEYLIKSLIDQGAQINSMGVGENLVCSKSAPVFGGVYKMSSVYENGEMIPKIKVSENVEKVTNPGFKDLYRIYDKESGKAIGDLMTLHGEVIDPKKDLTIYHQMNSWKNKTIPGGNYIVKDLLEPIFVEGQLVYDVPKLEEIRAYSEQEFQCMWDEILRFEYPQTYYVDLSKKLLDLKLKMLEDVKHG
ncbi:MULTISPECIES: nicotinate phosphoribosyltransferase [Bacillota]|uniref:Nicotinate phosphoribosyltransferase n=2 Tax=Amedibacillus TaxID=2749846 RepID=A0A7G9GL43_9FIRM|nr:MULTISPECIES: nicotinate phosphoribosyltransferase [Bacillota]QNM11525.1 nicotinate phosphoribosyltransferase [[Eubacterium] hominis]MCH4285233.1 nicotinate phosphoribosyltransferase [Amedibacillus hominis]RGB56256.1 nicotinate phosphoribosyltransferase [Absiella sp. AM22-9]RGB62019.1 nicotinate phosphoribosyltransferase [Absiella sp. AM10-20]RGB70159.1 nicotinate phosphoribosyltransferase [Absiella sp. AM09-45]